MHLRILICLFFVVETMLANKLPEGLYRAVLLLDVEHNLELPFTFNFKYLHKKPTITIHNADENILVDEIVTKGDSFNFKMPVFDTEFKCKIIKNGLEGVWINHYRKEKNQIKFSATPLEQHRFPIPKAPETPSFEGKWEVTFSPGTTHTYKAIGLFHHVEQTQIVHGTFLTETGDYRYLEGVQSNNKLYLSCFDGSHAFLFIAQFDSLHQLQGKFYSGSHWQENWTGKKNDLFELKKAETITSILDAQKTPQFSFKNLDDKNISLQDAQFQNKPVLIQIMGSWCPNCMDESAMLSPFYNQYKDQGLEIIALAFEKTTDVEIAKKQLKRLQNRFDINYNILITGLSGKTNASEIFPMLSDISAFPTLIYLNKQHQIVKIHTGFSGPATGKAYDELKTNTESYIQKLINQ